MPGIWDDYIEFTSDEFSDGVVLLLRPPTWSEQERANQLIKRMADGETEIQPEEMRDLVAPHLADVILPDGVEKPTDWKHQLLESGRFRRILNDIFGAIFFRRSVWMQLSATNGAAGSQGRGTRQESSEG
jgi:hypothetical protein